MVWRRAGLGQDRKCLNGYAGADTDDPPSVEVVDRNVGTGVPVEDGEAVNRDVWVGEEPPGEPSFGGVNSSFVLPLREPD